MNNKGKNKVSLVPHGRFAPTIPNERRRRKKQPQGTSRDDHRTRTENHSEESTKNNVQQTSKLKRESEILGNTVKQEPLIQATINRATDNHSSSCSHSVQLDSSDEEQCPTGASSHKIVGHNSAAKPSSLLPVVLPIANQRMASSQRVDDGLENNAEKVPFPKDSIASKLFQEQGWFFLQLPPILPIPDTMKRQQKDFRDEKDETVDESASREAKMQELKYLMSQNESQLYPDIRHMESCNLGTLRIFRSGKVELVMNGMTCELLQGAETNFLEKAMQVDWEQSTLSELGDIQSRLIFVPNVYNEHHLNTIVPFVPSGFIKMEEKPMSWKTE